MLLNKETKPNQTTQHIMVHEKKKQNIATLSDWIGFREVRFSHKNGCTE